MSLALTGQFIGRDDEYAAPLLWECDHPGCGARRLLTRSGHCCTGVVGLRHPPSTMEAICDDGRGEYPLAILSDEDDGWRVAR